MRGRLSSGLLRSIYFSGGGFDSLEVSQMPIVKFMGRVLPAIMELSFDSVPQVDWEATELHLHMKFTIRVVKSEVEIECEIERYQPEYLSHLYMRSFDLARACVDVAAFTTGISLVVHLDKFILPDGSTTSLLINDPKLAALCTAYKMPATAPEDRKNLEKILLIVLGESGVFMALNDLILANTLPHHAPANCARVLEGLRNLMTPTGMSRDKGWPIVRQNLQMDRAYLEFITGYSKGPRHGDRSHIPGDITMDIVGRTWTIMNRFLEFKKRGSQPLPLAEFPMLNG
jgi:hypothetical protein